MLNSKTTLLFALGCSTLLGCGTDPLDELLERHARNRGAGADAGVPPTPVPDGGPASEACWSSDFPAEVSPVAPKMAVAESCDAASLVGGWTDPGGGTLPSTDARDRIVGRWASCGANIVGVAHAAIEFGANGRWRLLGRDPAGALVAITSPASGVSGRYYALSSGQLNLRGEGPNDGGKTYFIGFNAGMDALRFQNVDNPSVAGTLPIYARAPASPLNGRDNVPSITDGRCSMVGTWDLPATADSPSASFSFDSAGNFVGGPFGSNLCAAHTMYGTYRLSPGMFQLTQNVGMGLCAWWYDAGYPATFDATCNRVQLVHLYDNCTGGRRYLNGPTTLVRRP